MFNKLIAFIILVTCFQFSLGCNCFSHNVESAPHNKSPVTKSGGLGGRNELKTISIPAVVPRNMLTGEPCQDSILGHKEMLQLLETPLPALSNENKDLSLEKVIEQTLKRQIIWLPPDMSRDDAAATHEAYADVFNDKKALTIGRCLRGMLTAGTETGYPWLRTFRRKLETPQPNLAKIEEDLNMMDVMFMTDKYIVIIAIPAK